MANYPEYVSPDGRTRLATSKQDEVALRFDGWVPKTELAARNRRLRGEPSDRTAAERTRKQPAPQPPAPDSDDQ